ncbi:MAG: P-II family nitrogen regulator [Nocardioides sp.]
MGDSLYRDGREPYAISGTVPGVIAHCERNPMKLIAAVIKPHKWDEVLVPTTLSAAQTGRIGDGKMSVAPIESVVSARTGEREAVPI